MRTLKGISITIVETCAHLSCLTRMSIGLLTNKPMCALQDSK